LGGVSEVGGLGEFYRSCEFYTERMLLDVCIT
jgi:hypothetical protein